VRLRRTRTRSPRGTWPQLAVDLGERGACTRCGKPFWDVTCPRRCGRTIGRERLADGLIAREVNR
jgi:hypothetical protein